MKAKLAPEKIFPFKCSLVPFLFPVFMYIQVDKTKMIMSTSDMPSPSK